jgi:hypothetical protein
MTDLTDQQHEALEHAEHSAHAAASGDPLTLRVTLSIAIMAVVAAFIGALGETEASHTFVEKNDAVLAQAKASDTWAAYQAESIKKHVYEAVSNLATTPETQSRLRGEADKYGNQQPKTQEEAKGFEAEVIAHGDIAERHFARHHILMIAEGVVHVAVAAASIALLSRRPMIWYAALGFTVMGMIIAGAAYAS